MSKKGEDAVAEDKQMFVKRILEKNIQIIYW
jgi:hypothetical protein